MIQLSSYETDPARTMQCVDPAKPEHYAMGRLQSTQTRLRNVIRFTSDDLGKWGPISWYRGSPFARPANEQLWTPDVVVHYNHGLFQPSSGSVALVAFLFSSERYT